MLHRLMCRKQVQSPIIRWREGLTQGDLVIPSGGKCIVTQPHGEETDKCQFHILRLQQLVLVVQVEVGDEDNESLCHLTDCCTGFRVGDSVVTLIGI